ncbi:hypothetical protein [uncultured Bacteroides sp.]|uniref:hypothetical protein n=1 Tax=uncultured Bacteroides sp. TaxID=162156 RepID=UPI002AA71C0C|nr:hypothetical protein [uncultured Bacteroides sp.]
MIRNDRGVFFKNYSTPDTIPFNTSVLSEKIKFDTYDADRITKKVNLKKLNEEFFHYFMKEYIASSEEFYKNLMGDDYMGIGVDTTLHNVGLFFCGKLTLQPGIQSLVLLQQESDWLHKNELMKSLILCNIKNNRLCSIISLSEKNSGIDTSTDIKSYLMQGNYFSRVEIGLLNGDMPEQLLTKLKIKEENSEVLDYSLFAIDKNGYVKFVKL